MRKEMNTENETNNREQEDIMSENKEEQGNLADQEQGQEGQPREENTTEEADELQKTRTELEMAKDKYLRLYSEFENFRRRTAKEKLEMVQTANEQLIKSLLPVLDDFERAEKTLDGTTSTREQLDGFLLIYNKLRKTVEQHGVKALPLEPGSDFDTDTQEAITQIPAPDEKLKGKVVDVIEKGYSLNDKVIRYAKVVVGN